MAKILVIDDDKLIRWSLKEIFTQEGYRVDTVASSQEALSLLEHMPYHLIFVDMEIADENGIEMMRKAKALQPELKIIILSAQTKNQIESQLGSMHVFSIIEKPFKSEQVREVVKNAFE